MEKMLTVLYCEPGKEAQIIGIENNVKTFEEFLKSPIELVTHPSGKHVLVCCDYCDSSALPNRSLHGFKKAMDKIVGPFFICRYKTVGGRIRFESLSDLDFDKFIREFGEPEKF